MMQHVYSLLDVKARQYGALVLATSDSHVLRSLKEAVPGSASVMERYPEDFHLMFVGYFDMETGVLEPTEAPILVTTVREALEVADGR